MRAPRSRVLRYSLPLTIAAETQATLAALIQRTVPRGLTAGERQQWRNQTEWLRSVERRLADVLEKRPVSEAERTAAATPRPVRKELDKATPQLAEAAGGDEDGPVGTAETLELELTRLQHTIQQESRRFQTLLNALKARHDAAMTSVRNMK